MIDGFVRVAVASPKIRVADVQHNSDAVIAMMGEAVDNDVALIVFPELVVTGYTCADLFFQRPLIQATIDGLEKIARASEGIDLTVIVGAPLLVRGKLYNCAVVIEDGHFLAAVPKTHLPNYSEFYEKRWFTPAPDALQYITLAADTIPFGTSILLESTSCQDFRVGIEICEDMWAVEPPAIRLVKQGATVIANLSASNDIVSKDEYRRMLVQSSSGRYSAAYLYANAGVGESTTDVVFLGHCMISESGSMLAESEVPFEGMVYAEIDIERLLSERLSHTSFEISGRQDYTTVRMNTILKDVYLSRPIPRHPFIPPQGESSRSRLEAILLMQSMGLVKRLEHIGARKLVLGISGGLDSTLALIVAVRAFDHLSLDRKGIIAVTMPCFGTSERTKMNAYELAGAYGITLREIDITRSVRQHFSDIGHDENDQSVTYENSQARERTQVLMDLANTEGAIVLGTGDLSELALGWATYNGDHMSMYGVNASIPKTLIRSLVSYSITISDQETLRRTLQDVLDTPVSPELLPPSEGEISQRTEDLVGPYELHDFFLYYMLRWSFSPTKIFHLAKVAFSSEYTPSSILSWLRTFYRRFFSQQFKRSALPDGVKVGSVALSPRGDLRMPSDASAAVWIEEVNDLVATYGEER